MVENQMQWRRNSNDSTLELWVDDNDGRGFVHYTNSKIYDPIEPGFSKGLATLQKGLKIGYKLLPARKEDMQT